MTISDLIRRITQDEYLNSSIYLRLTGRGSNYVLCVGNRIKNSKFNFTFKHFSSRADAIKEVKRLASIYITLGNTESSGHRVVYVHHQIIN